MNLIPGFCHYGTQELLLLIRRILFLLYCNCFVCFVCFVFDDLPASRNSVGTLLGY